MTLVNLPPELFIHVIRDKSDLKPGQWVWVTGKFDDMFEQPNVSEVVQIDSRIYDGYHLHDERSFLLGDPLPGGGVQNIGHFYYENWNIGLNPQPNNWYICFSEAGAHEIFDYLVFMYQYFE